MMTPSQPPARPPRRLLALTLLLACSPLLLPAGGSEGANDSVRLVVTAGEKLLADHDAFAWDDTVPLAALPPGATGLDLLHHAVAEHASTYTVTWQDEDAFVDEIHDVETDFTLLLAGYYWALYADGEFSEVAINRIVLEPGTHVELDYQGWPADL